MSRMSPAEREELHAAIAGTAALDVEGWRLGEAARIEADEMTDRAAAMLLDLMLYDAEARGLTANQRLAAEELARPCCRRCGIPRSEAEGHWCADENWRGWHE